MNAFAGSRVIGACVVVVEYAAMMADLQNVREIDTALLRAAMRRGFTSARADAILGKAGAEEQQRW